MTIPLRPFQQTLCDQIDQHWLSGARNVMPVAATGSGKTVVIAHMMGRESGHSVAIAHRQELVSQISCALARNGLEHRILGSASGKPSKLLSVISAMQTYDLGRPFINQHAKVAVGGVDTLARYGDDDSIFKRTGLVVIDECFAAHTQVGGRNICDLRPGDAVPAFNQQTHKVEPRKVVRVSRNRAPQTMIRLRLRSHHVIYCTSGHPFYTRRGWVMACTIGEKDEVLYDTTVQPMWGGDIDDERVAALPLQENRQDILHQGLRDGFAPQGGTESTHRVSLVQRMRQGCTSLWLDIEALGRRGPSLLRHGVQQCVQGASVINHDGRNEPQALFGTHAPKESDELAGINRKDAGDTSGDGAQAQGARRERSASNCGGASAVRRSFTARLYQSIHSAVRGWAQSWRLSDTLQNRLRKPALDDCNRGGRSKSRNDQPSAAGCEERRILAWVGVESAQVVESDDLARHGCSGWDGHVYNLEVEGLHTYLADGVVVHNCHHVTKENKWGRALTKFTNARGLLPTATPCRADGKGLGRHAHGLVDAMVLAPTMRDIINSGYLTDYRIAVPPGSRFHREALRVSASTGDFLHDDVVAEVRKAQIVGDVVASYLKFASGKRGVTFCVSVQDAEDQAAAYRAAGVPAVALSADTPDAERHRALQDLKDGRILQVTNVDLFGEGFDAPALEVVSFARPTQSLGMYTQQFGRVLRLMLEPWELEGYNALSDAGRQAVIAASGKPYGLIIDHVGNVQEHKLPDIARTWTLDARERSGASGSPRDEIPLRVCLNVACCSPFERVLPACPYCGEAVPEPAERSRPEYVDGDLTLLDEAALAAIRGDVARLDGPCHAPHGVPEYVARSIHKKHAERQAAQRELRHAVALWAGYQHGRGRTDSESYRRFYHRYGVDVATAQTLGRPEAEALALRVRADLLSEGVICD